MSATQSPKTGIEMTQVGWQRDCQVDLLPTRTSFIRSKKKQIVTLLLHVPMHRRERNNLLQSLQFPHNQRSMSYIVKTWRSASPLRSALPPRLSLLFPAFDVKEELYEQ